MEHTPLLADTESALQWLRQRVRGTLRVDSRSIEPGDGFIAWPGAATDGRRFLADALARGAAACLVEDLGSQAFEGPAQGVARLRGLKRACGPLASAWHGEPSRMLDVLAITGTNGKTSTAWWLAQALNAHGTSSTCGLVGTLGMGLLQSPGQALSDTGMTTPDPMRLQQQFAELVRLGASACAIEASSIGLAEGRLDGTHIRTAIFTNFTQDHLDYHGSMQAYWQAKAELFAWPGLRFAVVNVDDPQGAGLAQDAAARGLEVWTCSQHQAARLQAVDVAFGPNGMSFTVQEGAAQHRLNTALMGTFNVANLLGVLATLRTQGLGLSEAVHVVAGLQPVPGRMQCLSVGAGPLTVVDYAHTPDALDKALQALRPVAQARQGRLWCVFGCGGDRDSSKRALMGSVAEAGADRVVLTSDNPRSEAPERILQDILAGLRLPQQARVEPDRARAIAWAIAQAEPADVVLLAGKGHEPYQEVRGIKHPFSDVQHAQRALDERTLASSSASVPGSLTTAGKAAVMGNMAQVQAWLAGSQWISGAEQGHLASSAALEHSAEHTAFSRVHTDTRSLRRGDLFVALNGEHFDAHEFLLQAAQAGAAAALVSDAAALRASGLPGLVVPDTRIALAQLAAAWRQQFALPLIAVTGSNGKTTVTQMVAAVLRAEVGDSALATQGNFNNDIGVPLTLLRLRPEHQLAVVELGMNHPGEIAHLAALAAPTVALVNNAQREHLEFMDSVQAVAAENGSVLAALSEHGTAVFPHGDAYTPLWRSVAGGRRVWTFSGAAPAGAALPEVYVQEAQWQAGAWQVRLQTPVGVIETVLHIAGRHNVVNAAAAAACALAAGVSAGAVAKGLAQFEPVKGRSRALELRRSGLPSVTLVDDTYNANPDSVRAAIDVLAELPGPRLLVLGDMGEVGDQGPQFHAEVGEHARARGIDWLFTLGELSRHMRGQHFADIDALLAQVREQLATRGDVAVRSLLVKGSRFMKMERVVEAVLADASQEASESAGRAAATNAAKGDITC